MKYHIDVDKRAVKQLRELQPEYRDRVLDELDNLCDNPRPEGCRKLKGQIDPAWRVRVGDYRILYRIFDAKRLIQVFSISKRDEAYR